MNVDVKKEISERRIKRGEKSEITTPNVSSLARLPENITFCCLDFTIHKINPTRDDIRYWGIKKRNIYKN